MAGMSLKKSCSRRTWLAGAAALSLPLPLPGRAGTIERRWPARKPAPPLALDDLDGRRWSLAPLRGKVVVLNFWASWCEPCVREFPRLRQAASAHRADRLAVVGVLSGDTPAAARPFVRRLDATWPMALDPNATTATAWGAVGLPHTWFIRADGTLASHQLGELTQVSLDRQLAQIL
jgi:peroxiredoxin